MEKENSVILDHLNSRIVVYSASILTLETQSNPLISSPASTGSAVASNSCFFQNLTNYFQIAFLGFKYKFIAIVYNTRHEKRCILARTRRNRSSLSPLFTRLLTTYFCLSHTYSVIYPAFVRLLQYFFNHNVQNLRHIIHVLIYKMKISNKLVSLY